MFLKYPERGAVKTRLAAALGNELVYELYFCFLADISAMTRRVNAETVIVYTGPADAMFPDFPGVQCLPQRGKDIGEKMYFAFLDVFAQGFARCVLMGSDIPDLPAARVDEALEKLALVDVVLGPCTDGGYYLVGCREDSLRRSIFSGIPWSTGSVLAATLNRISEAGLKAAELPPWSDIDEFADLKNFYKRNLTRAAASQVMKFIKAKGIIDEL